MKKQLLLFRRWLLSRVVPEIYWPEQVVLDDTAIQIRHTPYSFGTRWLIQKGLYEKEERQLLASILEPGMQVIEMGGSIGILTAIIAKKIGKQGKLVSVEASSRLVSYSSRWLPQQGAVTVVEGFGFPVWNANGIQVHQFEETKGSLGGRLNFETSEGAENADNVYDLEKLCNRFGVQPELLVIDVEGSEIIMANQPIAFPSSVRYLLIELHKGLYERGKADEEKLTHAIINEGFSKEAHLGDVYLFKKIA